MAEFDFTGRFSVGLDLACPEADWDAFLERYHPFLSSVYFSLPLGLRFFSRTALAAEYEDRDKFFRTVKALRRYGVRQEITLNTYDLTEDDLALAAAFIRRHLPEAKEIVCLAPYAGFLRQAFPDIELKYSFNNIRVHPDPRFDTIVVGKEYLHDPQKRRRLVKAGYRVVLLLNNGCSLNCAARTCNARYCRSLFLKNLQQQPLARLYARQTLLPDELWALLRQDPCAGQYRFKISNRPLGVGFTAGVLDAYLHGLDLRQAAAAAPETFCLFCTLLPIYERREQLDYAEIMREKAYL